jgi:hypothetical protein
MRKREIEGAAQLRGHGSPLISGNVQVHELHNIITLDVAWQYALH